MPTPFQKAEFEGRARGKEHSWERREDIGAKCWAVDDDLKVDQGVSDVNDLQSLTYDIRVKLYIIEREYAKTQKREVSILDFILLFVALIESENYLFDLSLCVNFNLKT